MGRPREPAQILELKGAHMSRAELESRKQCQPQPKSDAIVPPSYLSAKQKKEFRRLADELTAIDLLANVDCDELARYITARDHYVECEKDLRRLPKLCLEDEAEEDSVLRELTALKVKEQLSTLQKRYYDQALASAKALGLNIGSRCRIEIPKAPPMKPNKFLQPAAVRKEG